jgi:hypothetical protein
MGWRSAFLVVGELLDDETVKSVDGDIAMRVACSPQHLAGDRARASNPATDLNNGTAEMSSLPERIKVEIKPLWLQ